PQATCTHRGPRDCHHLSAGGTRGRAHAFSDSGGGTNEWRLQEVCFEEGLNRDAVVTVCADGGSAESLPSRKDCGKEFDVRCVTTLRIFRGDDGHDTASIVTLMALRKYTGPRSFPR